MTRHPDMPEVSALLAERITELAPELVGDKPTSRTGTTWRFRTRGSLAVVVAGEKRGQWHDHEAGVGGDALALVAHLRGMPMVDAWRWALGWLGIADGAPVPAARPRPVAPPERPREAHQPHGPSDTLPLAIAIWREAIPAGAPDSLVPIYLATRGLVPEPGAPLRFHPSCPRGAERWPAMLGLMRDPVTGEPCGVHRTFLARDGSGKAPGQAKMMAGHAGVIHLVRSPEVTMGLGLAEGIETALSVMQRFAWRPVWAATSAGAIARFPVLPGIEALTIFADQDEAGIAAAERCTARWIEAGREGLIEIPPQGMGDVNDLARQNP